MTQRFDMAEKVKIYVDGEELQGLVNFGEISVERDTIEVPEFKKKRIIQSGIEKIPVIDLTFKISRGSNTITKIKDWYFNDEVHDVSKVRTDAHGVEFARTMIPGCECIQYHEPQFDGSSVTYAQFKTRLVPWDIQPIE